MITEDTVFIFGAGANVPYGFPTGDELRKKICEDALNSYLRLLLQKENAYRKVQVYNTFADTFIQAFAKSGLSIDSYLSNNHLNKQHYTYGKIAMTMEILKAEVESLKNDSIKYKQDWFPVLFQKMISEINYPTGYKEFPENKVTFITFNYDRCLEYLLYDTLQAAYFGNEEHIYHPILNKLPVHHVYGKFADLPWQGPPPNNIPNKLDYGDKSYCDYVESLSEKILTIWEDRNNQNSNSELFKEVLYKAKHIYFLGFAYQQENLDVLGICKNSFNENCNIYGTAYGYSEHQIKKIKIALSRGYSKNPFSHINEDIHIFPVKCQQLLQDWL